MKWAVWCSIFLSVLSLFTASLEKGECYPFFHWKLYTQPLGQGNVWTQYRLYGKSKGSKNYKRLSVKECAHGTEDAYVYSLNHLAELAATDAVGIQIIKAFAHWSHPTMHAFQLVLESYQLDSVAAFGLVHQPKTQMIYAW